MALFIAAHPIRYGVKVGKSGRPEARREVIIISAATFHLLHLRLPDFLTSGLLSFQHLTIHFFAIDQHGSSSPVVVGNIFDPRKYGFLRNMGEQPQEHLAVDLIEFEEF